MEAGKTSGVLILCSALALASPEQPQAFPSRRAGPSETPGPPNAQAEIRRANQWLQGGAPDQAITLLRQVLRKDPENADAHLLLGTALALVPEKSQALQELQRAAQLRPQSALAFYTLGTAFARFAEMEQARRALERALALNPQFADAHVRLGLILAQQKELDSARKQFEEALGLEGPSPAAAYPHYLLARVFAEQRRPSEAQRELETAIKLRPHYADAYLSLGLVRKDLHDDAGALEAFRQAAALSPGDPLAQFEFGSALLRSGRAAAAVKPLQEALRLRPDDRPTLTQLCRALQRAGRADEARACDGKASAVARAEAVADAQMLAAAKSNNEGVELEKTGDFLKALDKYRSAVELEPRQTEFRRNLALALCRLGRWEEGIGELREVLKAHPGDTQATQALYIALEGARSAKAKSAGGSASVPGQN